MLVLTRKAGDSFFIGDDIKVTVMETNGNVVKIAIDAPKNFNILRTELKEAGEVNREALNSLEDIFNKDIGENIKSLTDRLNIKNKNK